MLTTTDAAARAGVKRRAVLKAIRLGQLQAEKFGSAWAISEDALAAWLATRRGPGRPPADRHPGDASAISVPINDDDDSAEYMLGLSMGRLLPPR